MGPTEATRTIVVQLTSSAPPCLGVVDALARLQLAAQRIGWTVAVREPCPELVELIDLAGLREVLPLEARGKPEEGEELGVQEVMEP